MSHRGEIAATTPAPIDAESVRRVLAPFGRSRTMPAEAYTSAPLFEWEQRNFFESSWFCAGRSADLVEPGERRAVGIGRDSVLLIRDEGGELRVLYNVCRHRGHRLLGCDERGGGRALKCPYHGWVYGLDGSLRGAPHFGRDEIDRNEFGLIEVRSAEWHGWVFVNASGNAPEFSEHVGRLSDYVGLYEPERLVGAARHTYTVNANWKVIIENYHECYHCATIHPELCKVTPTDSGEAFEPDGMWVAGNMELMPHAETMSLTGESRGVKLRNLTAERERQVFYIDLFPNLLISPHPDYVMTHRLEPLAPDTTRIECEWLFAPEAVDEADFDPSYASDFWDITNMQDWGACEGVQKGASSRGFRQGPLAAEEESLYRFVTMVARGYAGAGNQERKLDDVERRFRYS